jgi:hypothetical protein
MHTLTESSLFKLVKAAYTNYSNDQGESNEGFKAELKTMPFNSHFASIF